MKTANIFFLACFLVVFSVIVSVNISYAQSEAGIGYLNPNTSPASFYYISKPGEVTMQVNIWGSVQKPGRYEVPTSTNLVQLVSYAGGPNQEAKISTVKVTRWAKTEGSSTKLEYYVDLDDLSTVDDTKLLLYPGDTIFIDRSNWSSIRDVMTVVTTAAIIISAITNVYIVKSRLK